MKTISDYRKINDEMDNLGKKAGITLPRVLYQ
jgi:hypothetical protein